MAIGIESRAANSAGLRVARAPPPRHAHHSATQPTTNITCHLRTTHLPIELRSSNGSLNFLIK